MKKNLFIFLLLLFISLGCNNIGNQNKEITQIALKNFFENKDSYVNKKIEITAIVNHVCKEGGKKMFLVSNDEENALKVIPGKNMAAFNTDLEGHTVKVIGVVEELKIDEKYLLEWEQEIKNEIENLKNESKKISESHAMSNKGENADQGQHISDIESIKNYRKEMVEKGIDHLSFYSIVCESYAILKPTEN